MNATSIEAKRLKEQEAEEAVSRMAESNYEANPAHALAYLEFDARLRDALRRIRFSLFTEHELCELRAGLYTSTDRDLYLDSEQAYDLLAEIGRALNKKAA
jgi:hypothetical protein